MDSNRLLTSSLQLKALLKVLGICALPKSCLCAESNEPFFEISKITFTCAQAKMDEIGRK